MIRHSPNISGSIWPQNYGAALAIAFDVDGPTGSSFVSGDIWNNPSFFIRGGYGPFRALPRILDLLDKFHVKATFFIPSWVVTSWPEEAREIVDRGHEAANHGHIHERFADLGKSEQHRVLSNAQRIFTDVLGQPATGFRTPSGDWSLQTPEILRQHGILYSSSMRDSDYPYFREDGSDLLEIPARSAFDDYAATAITFDPDWPPYGGRIPAYRSVVKRWQDEFDGICDFGGVTSTIFHPKVSGVQGKIHILERFLEHATRRDDVWIATHQEISSYFRSNPNEALCAR